MDTRHRMTNQSTHHRPLGTRRRGAISRSTQAIGLLSASLVCAAGLTALAVEMIQPEHAAPTASVSTQRPPQQVSQEGTLIAVSATSVTARSADGFTQTYLVTPSTTVITHRGTQLATSNLTLNDEVDIVGTVQDGTARATAVSDRDSGHGDAPPMDY